MKLVKTFFVAGLLLVTAPALAADTAEPMQSPAVPDAAVDAPFLEPAEGDCEPAAEPLFALEGQDPAPVVQTCGACSEPKCQGAIRGSACHLGIGGGWGHCNIYSGGNWCPTGGWECQCGQGPLP